MSVYFFILILSITVNFILIIPFINFLYHIKFQRAKQRTRDIFNNLTPIFDKFNRSKAGIPVGGGLLIIISSIILSIIGLFIVKISGKTIVSNYPIFDEIKILIFTFVSFSFLGLYDDLKKIFFWKKDNFFGLRFRHKFVLQLVLSIIIAYWMYRDLGIEILHIPFFGVINMGIFFIPFSAFIIISFANAVNITDGLDGLASGILMISLIAFWSISVAILDTPLLVFISVWLGGLIAFLYFNVHPARIFLGDTGALSFGATFAVIGLLLGKVFALAIIGGFFVIEILSSFLQLTWKKIYKRKLFPVAPFHLYLQYYGWQEPKIVARAWIISLIFAVFGLMISFLTPT